MTAEQTPPVVLPMAATADTLSHSATDAELSRVTDGRLERAYGGTVLDVIGMFGGWPPPAPVLTVHSRPGRRHL
jgi:hypothetical protein